MNEFMFAEFVSYEFQKWENEHTDIDEQYFFDNILPTLNKEYWGDKNDE